MLRPCTSTDDLICELCDWQDAEETEEFRLSCLQSEQRETESTLSEVHLKESQGTQSPETDTNNGTGGDNKPPESEMPMHGSDNIVSSSSPELVTQSEEVHSNVTESPDTVILEGNSSVTVFDDSIIMDHKINDTSTTEDAVVETPSSPSDNETLVQPIVPYTTNDTIDELEQSPNGTTFYNPIQNGNNTDDESNMSKEQKDYYSPDSETSLSSAEILDKQFLARFANVTDSEELDLNESGPSVKDESEEQLPELEIENEQSSEDNEGISSTETEEEEIHHEVKEPTSQEHEENTVQETDPDGILRDEDESEEEKVEGHLNKLNDVEELTTSGETCYLTIYKLNQYCIIYNSKAFDSNKTI